MPAAADCPSMPWCSTMRRSRNGRNTSVPAISTISNAWMLISPCDTRHAASASAAAAPIATPQSVMPRVMTLVESTRSGAVAQLARPLGEPPAKGPALAERLQGRQALDAVEKLRAEGFQRLLAPLAGAALDVDEDGRRDQGDECRDQHHRRDRHVPEGDEGKDRERRQHRDRQLRHVLAEKGLQLLDAVDDRQHDPAGALAGKPGRPQLGDLVVEAAAQLLLHPRRGAVRDHRAAMLDEPRSSTAAATPDRRQRHRDKAGAGEDMRQQHAEDHEAGDADDRGDEPQQDREARSIRAARASAAKGVGRNTSALSR